MVLTELIHVASADRALHPICLSGPQQFQNFVFRNHIEAIIYAKLQNLFDMSVINRHIIAVVPPYHKAV